MKKPSKTAKRKPNANLSKRIGDLEERLAHVEFVLNIVASDTLKHFYTPEDLIAEGEKK